MHPRQGAHRLLGQVGVGPLARDELGVAADRGQGGAQLVGGVGDELAYLRLGALPGGQGLLHVVQQGVEGSPHLPHLRGGGQVAGGHPLGDTHVARAQLEAGDPAGRRGHPSQGDQRAVHHGGAQDDGDDRAHQGHDRLDGELVADERVVCGHGQAGDDGVAGDLVGAHQDPVLPQGADADGDRGCGRGQAQQYGLSLLRERAVVAGGVNVPPEP